MLRSPFSFFAVLPCAVLMPIVATFWGCQPVETLEPNVCGNGVVEFGEDCDVHPNLGYECTPPDSESSCSFICKNSTCPAGYGCGTDNVCRRALGRIADESFASLPSNAQELLSGDFDADRRMDLVAVEAGRTKVYFFGASGDIQQTTIDSLAHPAVGKLGLLTAPADNDLESIDVTDDLTLPINLGISSLLGDSSRTFPAKAYGSVQLSGPPNKVDGQLSTVNDVVPMAFNAVPTFGENNSGDETIALFNLSGADPAICPPDGGCLLRFATGGSGLVTPIADGHPGSLLGPPVTGNFDSDPCQELVLPLGDFGVSKDTIKIYKMCVPKIGPNMEVFFDWVETLDESKAILTEISIGAVLTGPVFVFDVNGDTKSDLVITSAGGETPIEMRVAYGVGNGKVNSFPPPSVLDPNDPFVPDNSAGFYSTLPTSFSVLAGGDINGDGLIDFVDQNRILMARKTSSGVIEYDAAYTASRYWTHALIADINRDGLSDVVAVTANTPNVDVIYTTPGGLANPTVITTNGGVSTPAAGDYDGDLVNDIAFAEATSGDESILSVAYGRTSGGVEAPAVVGTFDSIYKIVKGNVHSFGVDGIEDMGVISIGAETGFALSFFPGSASRFLVAPYLLTKPPANRVQLPLTTAIGQLRPWSSKIQLDAKREAHNDTAVLAFEPLEVKPDEPPLTTFKRYTNSLRAWGIFGVDEAEFEPNSSSVCAIPEGGIYLPGFENATTIAVSPEPIGKTAVTVLSVPSIANAFEDDQEIRSMILTATFGEISECSLSVPYLTLPGQLLTHIEAIDLNGNGIPEVIGILKEYKTEDLNIKFYETLSQLISQTTMPPSPTSQFEPISSELVIFWDGVFEKDGALDPYRPVLQPEFVTDYTIGNLDGNGLLDVLVAGQKSIETYSTIANAAGLQHRAELSRSTSSATSLELSDFTGDGVADLAVQDADGLHFYRGETRTKSAATANAGTN